MTLDGRRCTAGRFLAALCLSLLGSFGLELSVLLGSCLGSLASLNLVRLLGALALQTVGGDHTLDLGTLNMRVTR